MNNMMADEGNSSLDESAMFFSAVGGSTRGRVKGFGCMLDDKVQKEKTRNRLNHAQYTASGLTNAEEGQTYLALNYKHYWLKVIVVRPRKGSSGKEN